MKPDTPENIPDSENELDDPYVHTVSTEEFIETVERASQEEHKDVLVPNGDSCVLSRPSIL